MKLTTDDAHWVLTSIARSLRMADLSQVWPTGRLHSESPPHGQVLPQVVTCCFVQFGPWFSCQAICSCLDSSSKVIRSAVFMRSFVNRPLPSTVLAKHSLFTTCDHGAVCLILLVRPCGFCVFLIWHSNFSGRGLSVLPTNGYGKSLQISSVNIGLFFFFF